MAKKADTTGDTAPETMERETRKDAEAAYTAEEFARNAERLFGARATADIVTAAFRVNGKETATLSEAKGIVREFMNREVR